MKVMTETTENTGLLAAVEPEEESVTGAAKHETSLTEVFGKTLDISQDVTECAASGETDDKEKLKQDDGQQDGQTASPPAAEPSSTQSKCAVGAQCRAVLSEDRQVSLDGERCKVQFSGFGSEEDVELSALKSPEAALKTQRQDSQDWKPGSLCRAVYSGDGLVYPAVVQWVKGQRCCVRYEDYNNEEEQDVSSLLNLDELHGPSRAAAKGGRRTSVPSRREEKQGERGAERRSAWRDDQNSSSVRERLSHQSTAEKEEKKRDGGHKPTNHSFPVFPPFAPPPPPQSSLGDSVSFIPPPPPPLWAFGGKDSAGADSASSMLMLWYMCGFHTGSYMTQQAFKSSSRD